MSSGAEPVEERDHARVVAADRRRELRDPGGARVGGELAREDRSDAAALVVVRDREGDLRGVPFADEPRDPDRLRVAVGVADEDVAVAIDPCERRELQVGEAGLRAAEAALPRAVAEALRTVRRPFPCPRLAALGS